MGLDISLYENTEDRKELMYWRKCNYVYRYIECNLDFHKIINDGEYLPITYNQLKEFNLIIKRVIDKPDLAEELLPTAPGPFFGSMCYDNYYFESLNKTFIVFENILANHPINSVFYFIVSS